MAKRTLLTEEMIVAKAYELADRPDVEHPGIRSIAAALDVKPQSLYRHFMSREQLEQVVADRAATALLNSMPYSRPRLAHDRNFVVTRELLEKFAICYIRFAHEHQSLYRLITVNNDTGEFAFPRGRGRLWRQIYLLISRFTGSRNETHAALAFWALLHGHATMEWATRRARTEWAFTARLDVPAQSLPAGVHTLLDGLTARAATRDESIEAA